MQSRGIGKRLLDFVKTKKTELRLNVYQKNMRAIRFYQREGFKILREGMDEATGEKDYEMTWRQEENAGNPPLCPTFFRKTHKERQEVYV